MKTKLKELNAFEEVIEWAADKSLKEIWKTCHSGDWMLWLSKKANVDKRKLTLAKALCAETVIHLMKDERSINAVKAAKNYGNGIGTDGDLKAAYADAYDAADDHASYAAVYAADDDDSDDDYASYAAAYAAAATSDRQQSLLQTSKIVRKTISYSVISRLLNVK